LLDYRCRRDKRKRLKGEDHDEALAALTVTADVVANESK
jgi:hypothetical protein